MSPPPGHEPFLRAICQAPDDDAPRLVFADWLDENRDPERAEFIRLQIRQARESDGAGLESRCEELFVTQRWKWVGDLPGTVALWAEFVVPPGLAHLIGRFADGDDFNSLETSVQSWPALVDWSRGFPAAVYVQGSSDLFLAHLEPITDLVPVDRMHLSSLDHPDELIRVMVGHRFLAKLRSLIVPRMSLPDDAAIALASSPFVTGLRFISIEAGRLTDRAGRAFAESPYLGGLEGLQLLHSEFNGTTRTMLQARFGFNVHL
jgi:uncharacterized protein (TIGR02996 family)